MAGGITPERTHGWLGVVLPLLERGSAILSLFMLVLGTVTVYGMFQEVKRVQGLNREIVERLFTAQKEHLAFVIAANDKQVELALKVAHCPPSP